MKISLTVSLVTLVMVIMIVYFLNHFNSIASDHTKARGYFAFNWSEKETSNIIMNYWRDETYRVTAIKNIIYLDYVFMIVYCTYLCLGLRYRYTMEQHYWLKTWLIIGIGAVLLCTIIDAIQDYKIYRYVLSNDYVSEMRYYTFPKWSALFLGIIPLVLSVLLKGKQ